MMRFTLIFAAISVFAATLGFTELGELARIGRIVFLPFAVLAVVGLAIALTVKR